MIFCCDLRPGSVISFYFAGFPNVMAASVEHIPITAPSVIEGDYVNRKSFQNINVQVH